MSDPIFTLAIDTSCDDTSVAVLKDDQVLANVVSSQIDIHQEWGGVVPMLAKRAHEERIDAVVEKAFLDAGTEMSAISVIAVTYGPGLAPALGVGIKKAKELCAQYQLPLIAVNHLEGHVLSGLLRDKNGAFYSEATVLQGDREDLLPVLAFIISGGHTELVLIKEWGTYEKIGQTVDDAAGEAFDKVARLLELPYPGGPQISKLAEGGNPKAYDLPRPMSTSQDLNFSYAGLKTACLYKIRDIKEEIGESAFESVKSDFAASFEQAVVDSLLIKLKKAISQYDVKTVLFGGGVIANKLLRQQAEELAKKLNINVIIPSRTFCMDNAAMIGLAGYFRFKKGEVTDQETLDRNPVLSL